MPINALTALQPPVSEILQLQQDIVVHAKVLFCKISGTIINFQFQLLQIQLPGLTVTPTNTRLRYLSEMLSAFRRHAYPLKVFVPLTAQVLN